MHLINYINPSGARMMGKDDRTKSGYPFAIFMHRDYAGGGNLDMLAEESLPAPIILVGANGYALPTEIEIHYCNTGTFLIQVCSLAPTLLAITDLLQRAERLKQPMDALTKCILNYRRNGYDPVLQPVSWAVIFGW